MEDVITLFRKSRNHSVNCLTCYEKFEKYWKNPAKILEIRE